MAEFTISQAKHHLAEARAALNAAIKEALADSLLATFADADSKNVVFGVSTCPYNDGSLHEGIFGPYKDFELAHEDDFDHDDQWNLLDYRNGGTTAGLVNTVLQEAGWENVAEAFGLDTNQAVAIVATRVKGGDFKLHQYTIESDY